MGKYTSGSEKIKAEAEQELKKIKKEEQIKVMEAQMKPIVDYISGKCDADPEYNALVIQDNKSWERCYKYMYSKAQKMAESGASGLLVEGDTIFQWIDEYYALDDKAEIEAEKKAAEERKKRIEENKKKAAAKAAEPPSKPADTVKKEEPVPEVKKKTSKSELSGQMDLFSMFDM